MDLAPSEIPLNDYIYIFVANTTCYHENTFVNCPDGVKKIVDIKRGDLVETGNGFRKVVKLIKSDVCNDIGNTFVVFKAGSLGNNTPDRDLMLTRGHPVYFRGKYLNCLEFINNKKFKNIYLEKRKDSNALYHIQLRHTKN